MAGCLARVVLTAALCISISLRAADATFSAHRFLLDENSRGGYGGGRSDGGSCTCPGGFNFDGRELTLREDVLPVPADVIARSNAAQLDPSVDFVVEKIKEDVYTVINGLYAAMFAITDAGVVLFDAPQFLGEFLPEAISSVTDKPITHVIYSHSHLDTIGGTGALSVPPDVEIISSAYAAKHLAAKKDPRRPVPTKSFQKELKLTVGGLGIELFEAPDGHTEGDIIAYLPQKKIAMSVDIVYPDYIPFQDFGQAMSFPRYLETVEELINLDADAFFVGHFRTATRHDVMRTRYYVLDVRDAAAAVLLADEVNVEEIVVRTAPNFWLGSNELVRAREDMCFKILEPRWAGVLAGFDVYTRSHCRVALQFLSTD